MSNATTLNPQGLAFGTGSRPELADHGFQDMVVLPGAWYLAAALAEAGRGAVPAKLARAQFHQPLILGETDSAMTVESKELENGRVKFLFRASETGGGAGEAPLLAEIESAADAGDAPARAGETLAAFKARAGEAVVREQIYARLLQGGNRYGPRFQGLSRVWRHGTEAAAEIARLTAAETVGFDPFVADTAVQLLAVLAQRPSQTFVLRAIAEIRVARAAPTGPLWARGRLQAGAVTDAGSARGVGDVVVYGADGSAALELLGVEFSFIENTAPAAQAPLADLVIAATFTAEPIEDGLKYWIDELQLSLRPRFAPYNQVFQQLLDANGAVRQNRSGANVLLLNLADWLPAKATAAPAADPSHPAWPEGAERHRLPNGAEVAHLNRHETEYVYQEIFEDRCYLRHGIRLPAGGTVVDIGANIGLFSLFVRAECPSASVYSYEPSPIAFRALEANCRAYGPGLHACNAGVSQARGQAALTFYARSSVFSSFHPDRDEDRAAIQTVVENMVRTELGENAGPVDDYVGDLMSDRLDARTFTCDLVSVSDIIRDHGLRRIHLLKIDAEKCELEILRGIEAEHWARIDQIVIEVHDRTRAAVTEVQDILERQGFRCACEEERLLTGSGLFNVYAVRPAAGSDRAAAEESPVDRRWTELQAKAEEFERALAACAGAGGSPLVVCFCPPPTHGVTAVEQRQLAALEERLLARVLTLPGIQAIASAALLRRHPGAPWHHAAADTLGHVPFTPEGFALLAANVARCLAASRRAPLKVIALDCDHTLWRGTCGEDGPLGVVVGPAQRALQEFMIRRMQEGMMLCLCTKNSESDVWAVFERNPAMALKREHLTAARIDWQPKSDNLRALARELKVGAESIVFLDDNPVEIAEVSAHLPAVLALTLPEDFESRPEWLEQVWAFDAGKATAEDRARTQMMHESAAREKFREKTASLADFIAGLGLNVRAEPPGPGDWERLAQLTQRTNQFNFTTVRRSEFELRQFLENEGGRALMVHVQDRFGDYGCVGLVLYRVERGVCSLDTFLLSCRVLGRGVEHRVLATLAGSVAEEAEHLDLLFAPTAKNQPAADFAAALPAAQVRPDQSATVYRFATRTLQALRYDPAAAPAPAPAPAGAAPAPAPLARPRDAWWQQTADLVSRPDRLLSAIEAHRLRAAGLAAAPASDLPDTLAGKLLALWRRILGNPQIGMNDNFLDAGGTSLKAVQVVAAMRRELRLPVSVTTFFECPTVRRLSEKLEPPAAGPAAPAPGSDALERGAKRKLRLRRPAA